MADGFLIGRTPGDPAPAVDAAARVDAAAGRSCGFGQALIALARTYFHGAKGVCGDLPGGPKGYHVLCAVAEGASRTQAHLADSLGVDRTVMTYTIDELEAAGLVERRQDPRDRRVRRVVLTGAGRARLEARTAELSEVEARMLAVLDEREVDTLVALMRRLAQPPPPADA